jgi:anti-sigma B factor antagonist
MESLEIQRAMGAGPKTTVLRLNGPLTLATLFDFQSTVREPGYTDTIIDLTGVPYIDSAGLGAILAAWAHRQTAKDKFAVVGANERVQVLFKITKVETLLPIFTTAEEAERSF